LLPRKKSSLKGNPYDIRHGESTTDQKKRKPENQMSGKSGYGNWYKISAEKYGTRYSGTLPTNSELQ
jgi:hypothetical protein